MRNLRNMLEVAAVGVDYLGFIFYRSSKRYVGDKPDMELFNQVKSNISKVGVFVDEDVNTMLDITQRYNLNVIQLHGGETPLVCEKLKAKGVKVIKAFGVYESFDFSAMQPYTSVCNYFLFDTRSEQHGGTGIKFNWHKIDEYEFDIPFFLSGGIGAEDAGGILKLAHPLLHAVDINSRFEAEPGLKQVKMIKDFVTAIKTT
ncbi:MAG: phosphoribosylanthranilate isomerase [Bacteroidales bacterium]|nr:phosphoribosylanthranilate isomerase [Bacteroidales bacterium]